jgi:hypothetical protein
MIPLQDNEHNLLNPCENCEHAYIENIWYEWDCFKTEKTCPYIEEYRRRELCEKIKGI